MAFAMWAFAGVFDDVEACLDRGDVGCAKQRLSGIDLAQSQEVAEVISGAHTSFSAGEYQQARALMDRAVSLGWADKHKEQALYTRTALIMDGFSERRQGRYVVRYRPGLDAVLVDEAVDALRRSEQNVASLLGGSVPGPVIVEFYPDGRSFIECSSLPEESVKTTGVVALSKWSRLLVTSPRALGRGYGWKDTVAHEFIHEVVAHRTDDRAPVWLQEAIAKYLDSRWPDGREHFHTSPRDQSLLAEAIREEDGRYDPEHDLDEARGFVPFEQMHPSLALLPNANRAGLAYAQLSSLMSYVFKLGGDHVLEKVLPEVKNGVDPRLALARGAGVADFDLLVSGWKAWLKRQKLAGTVVESTPTVLDGGDEAASDPVMSKRQDLMRWVHLGDRLAQQGHPTAALIEYAKAIPPDEPSSPLLANRIAKAKASLGDHRGARAVIESSLVDYPEYTDSWVALGAARAALGMPKESLEAWSRAAELNPFDLEVQASLVSAYRAAGDLTASSRHERYLTILRRGGADHDAPIPPAWTPAGESR
jgi:hypothetical protein